MINRYDEIKDEQDKADIQEACNYFLQGQDVFYTSALFPKSFDFPKLVEHIKNFIAAPDIVSKDLRIARINKELENLINTCVESKAESLITIKPQNLYFVEEAESGFDKLYKIYDHIIKINN